MTTTANWHPRHSQQVETARNTTTKKRRRTSATGGLCCDSAVAAVLLVRLVCLNRRGQVTSYEGAKDGILHIMYTVFDTNATDEQRRQKKTLCVVGFSGQMTTDDCDSSLEFASFST